MRKFIYWTVGGMQGTNVATAKILKQDIHVII